MISTGPNWVTQPWPKCFLVLCVNNHVHSIKKTRKDARIQVTMSRKIAVLCAVNLARNSVIVARSPFVRACGMVTSSYLNHIMSDWLHRFYRATLCMCRPSFCLFVASRCSIETDERIEMVFTARRCAIQYMLSSCVRPSVRGNFTRYCIETTRQLELVFGMAASLDLLQTVL